MGIFVRILFLAILIVAGISAVWPWIEEVAFTSRAEKALADIREASVPEGFQGDVLHYPDGWILVVYGHSRWAGAGGWNHHLARDSQGQMYESHAPFIQPISRMADIRHDDGLELTGEQDRRVEQSIRLVQATRLLEAQAIFTELGFTRRY